MDEQAERWSLPALRDRARYLMTTGPRCILGLVGVPGAGKSTLAAALAEELGPAAMVVPMDGYHLANVELGRLGRADRKGAPDTFDVFGYRALLERLRDPKPDETVYAPLFRREIEEPIAGAIGVGSDVRLIITEGNYLLMDQGPWASVHTLLDESWFLTIAEPEQRRRLAARHVRFGRSQAAAEAWVESTDMPNARLIAKSSHRATLCFQWADDITSDCPAEIS